MQSHAYGGLRWVGNFKLGSMDIPEARCTFFNRIRRPGHVYPMVRLPSKFLLHPNGWLRHSLNVLPRKPSMAAAIPLSIFDSDVGKLYTIHSVWQFFVRQSFFSVRATATGQKFRGFRRDIMLVMVDSLTKGMSSQWKLWTQTVCTVLRKKPFW